MQERQRCQQQQADIRQQQRQLSERQQRLEQEKTPLAQALEQALLGQRQQAAEKLRLETLIEEQVRPLDTAIQQLLDKLNEERQAQLQQQNLLQQQADERQTLAIEQAASAKRANSLRLKRPSWSPRSMLKPSSTAYWRPSRRRLHCGANRRNWLNSGRFASGYLPCCRCTSS